MPEVIDDFRGEWRALSNYSPHPVTVHGVFYPTNEHFYNAMKTVDLSEQEHIRSALTPGEAKRRGRNATLRAGWDSPTDGLQPIKFTAMELGLHAKFTQNEDAFHVLMRSSPDTLIEGNRWHDQIWGDCRCGRSLCVNAGSNWLGYLLMKLRYELYVDAYSSVAEENLSTPTSPKVETT